MRPSVITTSGRSMYLPPATSSSRSALTATVAASAPPASAQKAAAIIRPRIERPRFGSPGDGLARRREGDRGRSVRYRGPPIGKSRLDAPVADKQVSDDPQSQGWATARTLAEALPYIQRYDRETVVIKYGGHAMGEEEVAKQFAADSVLLKMLGLHPVIVHGGGPQISAMLERAGVKSTFIDGLRVTDAPTMEVAEMVLSGAINKEIASWITQAGAEADVRGVGLSGKDARLITVEKARRTRKDPGSKIEEVVDLGFVGEPSKVDPKLIEDLINSA